MGQLGWGWVVNTRLSLIESSVDSFRRALEALPDSHSVAEVTDRLLPLLWDEVDPIAWADSANIEGFVSYDPRGLDDMVLSAGSAECFALDFIEAVVGYHPMTDKEYPPGAPDEWVWRAGTRLRERVEEALIKMHPVWLQEIHES